MLAVVPEVITGARSFTVTVTVCVLKAPDASLAFTSKLYELLVSKFDTALIVTTPVAELMLNAAESPPVRLKVTVPVAGSAATAVYTVEFAAAPSLMLAVVPEVIVGARSLTEIVTVCVLNAPEASLAFTSNVYELFVSKFGVALIVTMPVLLSIVNEPASAPERLKVTAPVAGSEATAV